MDSAESKEAQVQSYSPGGAIVPSRDVWNEIKIEPSVAAMQPYVKLLWLLVVTKSLDSSSFIAVPCADTDSLTVTRCHCLEIKQYYRHVDFHWLCRQKTAFTNTRNTETQRLMLFVVVVKVIWFISYTHDPDSFATTMRRLRPSVYFLVLNFISYSPEMNFPSVLWRCWLGDRNDISDPKKTASLFTKGSIPEPGTEESHGGTAG